MSWHQSWIFYIVSTLTILIACVTHAHAFCFAPQLRVSDEYFVSNLVLTGTVIREQNIYDPADKEYILETIYSIRVDSVYRGHPPTILKIHSENATGRYPMDLNQQYVLFLTKDSQGHWFVDNCGNSVQTANGSDTLEQLTQLPLRQSFVYGEVYSYMEVDKKCEPMKLNLRSPDSTAQTTIKPDCTFQVDVPPGRYTATLLRNGSHVAANDPNYKDIYCFVVPKGGSAGISFRLADGADALNRASIAKDDRHARSLCAKQRNPQFLF